jgi:nucleoside-diphosphate-sugar epimerase
MSKPISLVTGACGFMGTHMVEILHAAGHHVRATDLPEAIAADDRKVGRFPSVARGLGVELVASDMTKPETLAPLVKDVDYVFHIASVFNYTAPWEVLYRVNVQGCRTLVNLAAAQSSLKRFVLWGAGGVYGLAEPWMLPLREDQAPNPPNDYLRSKWMQEFYCMEQGRQHDFPFAIMRPTTVYGPRAVYGGGMLVMSMAEMKVVACPSNFTGRIPFIHVRDVCSAALHLALTDAARGEIFNLNDDSQMTNIDFMRFMADLCGHTFVSLPPIPIATIKKLLIPIAEQLVKAFRRFGKGPSPLEPATIEYLGLDYTYSNQKLKSTGYTFIYADARDGLRDTVRWYKEQGWIH